ncbi:MAG: hypothetical protein OIN83_12455 [Candidatus Methanoperedens sp.]|nr:hypothetical protein [Candidatus Methanoperedens sp.]
MIAGRKNMQGIKWAVIFVVLLYFVNIAAAFDVSKLQWDIGKSGTLKRNEVISHLGYSVEVVGFNAPVESDRYKQIPIEPVEAFVGLNLSKNGSFITEISLGQGESYVFPDGEFKVTAVELPQGLSKDWLFESYSPWIRLELNPRGTPKPEIVIDSEDEAVSAPNTELVVKVTLKNTGSADLTNINMDIGTQLPVLNGNLKYYYETLKNGREITETITFSTPVVMDLKKFDISVNVNGTDIKGIEYKSITLKTILIAPQAQKAPLLKKTMVSKMYMKDQILVSLYFKNNANYELKNVSIVDTIPKGFRQLSNNSLRWIVNIPPNAEWSFRYLLKPTESNSKGVLFPPTIAELKLLNEYYMIQSNRPEVVIYGPRIDLSKHADVSEINRGDAVTVTVVALNSGSTPSMVTVNDSIPSNVELISGTTEHEEYLEANKDMRFSYTIRSNSDGPIKLPRATARFYELGSEGTKINTTSQELVIKIKSVQIPEPTPVPTVKTPVNSTEKVNTSQEPAVKIIQKPNKKSIKAPVPEPFSADANAVLNLLIGCNSGIDPEINLTSGICRSVSKSN